MPVTPSLLHGIIISTTSSGCCPSRSKPLLLVFTHRLGSLYHYQDCYMSKRQNTSLYQGTALIIAEMTDAARFQTLGDRLLVAQWQYGLRPRGRSEHGTVAGQPDSWAYDSKGRLCAIQYGICKRAEWPGKLEKDLKEVKAIKEFLPEVFIFCTNCAIDADKEREWVSKVKANYQWELRIIGVLELADILDTTQQGIRKDVLGIEVEKHNWNSLLAACKEQYQKQITQT